jgi:hypothetical protein
MVCINTKLGEYARYINGRRYVRTRLAAGDTPLTAEEVENFRVCDDLLHRDPPEAA